jgi:hypothetical protein
MTWASHTGLDIMAKREIRGTGVLNSSGERGDFALPADPVADGFVGQTIVLRRLSAESSEKTATALSPP